MPGWAMMCLVAIALISLIALLGRGAAINNSVQAAAFAAARDASLSRGGGCCSARDRRGEHLALRERDLPVLERADRRQRAPHGSRPGRYRLRDDHLRRLLRRPRLPGLEPPGTFTVTKTEHSPVDPYRER